VCTLDQHNPVELFTLRLMNIHQNTAFRIAVSRDQALLFQNAFHELGSAGVSAGTQPKLRESRCEGIGRAKETYQPDMPEEFVESVNIMQQAARRAPVRDRIAELLHAGLAGRDQFLCSLDTRRIFLGNILGGLIELAGVFCGGIARVLRILQLVECRYTSQCSRDSYLSGAARPFQNRANDDSGGGRKFGVPHNIVVNRCQSLIIISVLLRQMRLPADFGGDAVPLDASRAFGFGKASKVFILVRTAAMISNAR
jgi:hypothetical protein